MMSSRERQMHSDRANGIDMAPKVEEGIELNQQLSSLTMKQLSSRQQQNGRPKFKIFGDTLVWTATVGQSEIRKRPSAVIDYSSDFAAEEASRIFSSSSFRDNTAFGRKEALKLF